MEYSDLAQIISLDYSKESEKIGEIAIVSAGTSDLPISLEAEITARFLGAKVKAYRDVGVAGVHRLLDKTEEIKKANVIIALSLIHISEPTRLHKVSRMPSSA